MRKAFQLHNEMLRHNLQPSPATYNILLNGLCVNRDLTDADRFFSSLQDQNIRLTKVAYTTLIKAHCVKGDACKADVLFRQMVEKGFEISITDYSAVINRLCKKNLTIKVKVFLHMLLSDGISLDQEICFVMLNAFRRVGDLTSEFELLVKMIKCGLLPA
ncbi:tetratricopeptide repeat (TPR)-like superfamily protein [Actinidia rufa]|uniref:Tetratricopeptide repeat (TPR)-like superfamily protein n=1 Tax=Actinidia rufa TaxID=165716 RepID=A0A7J0FN98_9ERIC|nr:tetratricopeptide repeat (TPR)-like superfamily protein [Actinidia rufa]